MTLEEREFKQGFDLILTKTRPTLDIEKDRYPGDEVTFYLNGTTGKLSEHLDDVTRNSVTFNVLPYKIYKDMTKNFLSAQYDEKQELVFIHMVHGKDAKIFRKGTLFGFQEFGRFAVKKNNVVYVKEKGFSSTKRGYCSVNAMREIEKFNKISKNGEYMVQYDKHGLPLAPANYNNMFGGFLNMDDGSNKGFTKILSNIYPEIFCVSGNIYKTLSSYEELYEYFDIMKKGASCIRKSGKKQDYIDRVVKLKLPEVKNPNCDNCNVDQFKFAVIQKVEGASEPTCCIRTMIYDRNEEMSYANGRIYVTKKEAEFCKVNNMGEWVHQPFPQKPDNWDFDVENFDESMTEGTMLEYFGSVLSNIEDRNKALAIYVFIKYPLIESLAKIMPEGFINSIIMNIRWTENINEVLEKTLGIQSGNKKALKALGINKDQLAELKPVILSGIKGHYLSSPQNKTKDILQVGMLPFLKHIMCGEPCCDVSSYDIETFKAYLNFATDIFSAYEIFPHKSMSISNMINEIVALRDRVFLSFPNFNGQKLFTIFADLVLEAAKNGYSAQYSYQYTANQYLRLFNDYLDMLRGMPNPGLYKPEFSSFEDLRLMHDNLSIVKEISGKEWTVEAFKNRHSTLWEKWEFSQEEKRNKEGDIVQNALPFIVVAPKSPIELANEGTVLHHCVKHYIDRVAEGQTNIMFIRKVEEPDEPFFTVEVSNDKKIEQVHGFSNRNACTEPGLEDFVEIWAKKKRLKTNSIDKVR